jgi:hypothetical protein
MCPPRNEAVIPGYDTEAARKSLPVARPRPGAACARPIHMRQEGVWAKLWVLLARRGEEELDA